MSLADLKKQPSIKPQRKFTVDEFIDDAANYAIGDPQVVSTNKFNTSVNADLQAQAQLLSKKIAESVEETHDKPFKHATFTLSEETILQLNELAEKTKIAKSRLLRILVNNFYYEDNPNKLFISKVK